MTRVSFYKLPVSDHDARLRFACRLAEVAFRQGHKVYLHTASADVARQLDELMWVYRPQSFLPHEFVTGPETTGCAVAIGSGADCGDHHDVLINLAAETPAFFSRFERVTEIVIDDEELKQAKRQSYRFYQERGYPNDYHNITAAQLAAG